MSELVTYRNKSRLILRILEDTGGATIDELARELYGESNQILKHNIRQLIHGIKRTQWLKAEGKKIFSINGVHQVASLGEFVEATKERSEHATAYLKRVQEMIIYGLLQYPELTDDLIKIAQASQKQLQIKQPLTKLP